MTTPSPTTIASLARAWDDIVLKVPTAPDVGASEMSETLHMLYRPDHRLDADPLFVSRLQRDLLETWRRTHHHTTQETAEARIRPHGLASTASLGQVRRQHIPRNAGVFATAALLLLTLISAIGLLASAWQPTLERGRVAETISAPILPDPATALGVLTSVRAPELPSFGRVSIDRWTYPPRADAVTTEKLTGPLLIYVIKGEVAISLSGGEAMLVGEPSSPLNPLSTLSTSTGEVQKGQSLLLPAHTTMTTSNLSDREAVVIATSIVTDNIDDWTLPFGQRIIREEDLGGNFATFPPGQVEITLERALLAAGETIPGPREGAVQLVSSESKFLAYLRRATDGAVTNLENEPLRVLILTVAPAG